MINRIKEAGWADAVKAASQPQTAPSGEPLVVRLLLRNRHVIDRIEGAE